MSELRRLDELKSDAQRAADEGLDPELQMEKYEPTIRCIWFTEYCKRLSENQRQQELA